MNAISSLEVEDKVKMQINNCIKDYIEVRRAFDVVDVIDFLYELNGGPNNMRLTEYTVENIIEGQYGKMRDVEIDYTVDSCNLVTTYWRTQ